MKMFVHMLRVGHLLDQRVNDILKQFDITHMQFNVLRSLELVSPNYMSVGEVKEQLIYPTPDVSRMLDRLEKKALIHRVICPENRRKINVSITTKGLQMIKEILPRFLETFHGFFKEIISEKERDTMISLLKRIS